VSGGDGSELYRVTLPDPYCGLSIDEVAVLFRAEHKATLLSINRGGQAFVNPGADFRLQPGDDAIVVAESLGALAPLTMSDASAAPRTASVVPSA
jgi:voltage-gated potassium channel